MQVVNRLNLNVLIVLLLLFIVQNAVNLPIFSTDYGNQYNLDNLIGGAFYSTCNIPQTCQVCLPAGVAGCCFFNPAQGDPVWWKICGYTNNLWSWCSNSNNKVCGGQMVCVVDGEEIVMELWGGTLTGCN